ncbi:MAG: gamma carbonic anhydrase family protein [Rhizomicrobium sp.]
MPVFALDGERPEFPSKDKFWIAPTATLIGRVRLLPNASIWFGAVLRGDNDWIVIGENSNIQDNCVIHTDAGQPVTVGTGVTIGHSVILHAATIGDHCLVGMGSTVLSGARIGPNSLLGANTLVQEKKEIPANSLVLGQPARVVRQVTDSQLALIRASALMYVANWRRFESSLAPLA